MAAPTPEPALPQRTEAPKPPQPTRPAEERQSKSSPETQARVQEKRQQIERARQERQNAEQQSEQAKAKAQQQAKQRTELGVEDLKHPILDDSDTAIPSTEPIERQTLEAIAKGDLPPPSPKLDRIIYHVCKEFDLNPTNPADIAKVQEVVRHIVRDSKLYSYIQDGTDLGKAMSLARVSIIDLKAAYERAFGESLNIDSLTQLDPTNIDQLAKVVVAFEDVTTSQEYISRTYVRLNTTVKERYLKMFARDGATEQTFDKTIQKYTEKALDTYTPGFSMLTLTRFFYGHHPEQNQPIENREQPEAPIQPADQLPHEYAIQLAARTHAYIEQTLENVQIANQSVRIEDMNAQKYSEAQLAQAFIENAEKNPQGREPALEHNHEEVTRQVSDISLLMQHASEADQARIRQELTTLMIIERALQRALSQTRQENLPAAA